ncbi:FmdB family zinc ribbon protein [Kaarinaea lacus]
MPIYEYECQACGHTQEAIQKMSDDPLVDCPSCNKPELKKLLSAPAFRLKGGGWYETDFKGGKQKNVAKDEKAGGSGSNESSASKESSTSKTSSADSGKSSGGCSGGACGCH